MRDGTWASTITELAAPTGPTAHTPRRDERIGLQVLAGVARDAGDVE